MAKTPATVEKPYEGIKISDFKEVQLSQLSSAKLMVITDTTQYLITLDDLVQYIERRIKQ